MKKLFLSLLIFVPFLSQADLIDDLDQAVRESNVSKVQEILKVVRLDASERELPLELAQEIIVNRKEKHFCNRSDGEPDYMFRSITCLVAGAALIILPIRIPLCMRFPVSVPFFVFAYIEKEQYLKACRKKYYDALTIKKLISMAKTS